MEFWGVEVKAGQPLKVKPNFDNIIHLSQASLGESKKEKGHDSVPLFVKFGDKKLVLGTLIPDNIPQLSFDLVFEKEFELSHNWKNGSIYFCGYQTPLPMDSSDEFDMGDSDEEEQEELPSITAVAENVGKKRPTESATKTPVPAKKAKTPMSDGKKGVHVATPHPSKGVKTPNAKTQTPKSGGQVSCSSCSKTFNSENALQSHTKAKHSAK
ncbi:hypothetical protein CUMW_225550 [Citrus unshiu]|uniref:C2H2-type domain-containing protein n=1 Tax=Citrus unshiu TaxID=55188 RepID=A0A2H5QFM8_CITUN|nr:hypothetical protein CUMW_225550 [Citrus unshiu]